jgi:beta-galactosidase
VIVDAESRWALETRGLPSPHVRHLDVARALHGALWRAGIGCDVVRAGGDLSRYGLVVVPAVYLLSPAATSVLHRYVEGGGHVVVTFCSGIADSAHRVYTGGYPGALRDVLGVRVEEFHPLRPGETSVLVAQGGAGDGAGRIGGIGELRDVEELEEATGLEDATGLEGARGRLWTERLRSDGATVLARYAEGALAGLPAVTRHAFGAGTAWYVSTLLEDDALEWLIRAAAAAAGVVSEPSGGPPGLTVSRRTDGDGNSWLFAGNHGDDLVTLAASGHDLLSGLEVPGTLELHPGAVAVIRERPRS